MQPMDFEGWPRPPAEDGSGSGFLLDWIVGASGSGQFAFHPQDKLDTETLSRAPTTMWGKFGKGDRLELC